jgi:steroid 5-alpha reductase family enzyme
MDWTSLFYVTAFDFAVQWVGAAAAIALSTEKFYDLTGAVTYCLISLWMLFQGVSMAWGRDVPVPLRNVLLPLFVIVWCVRLGTFLAARVMDAGEDKRFHEAKQKPALMFFYWTMQGLWVVITIFPIMLCTVLMPALERDASTTHWMEWVGWSVWAAGFLLEVVADRQKDAFRKRRSKKGYSGKAWINEGVWRWSQHPNYFGEMTLWWGLWFSTGASLPLLTWLLCAFSPLFLTFLITKVSGIPLLRKAALERWGSDPEYMKYRNTTSLLFPLPPSSS